MKSTKSKGCREGILNDVKVVSGGLNSVFIAPKSYNYDDIGLLQPYTKENNMIYSQQAIRKAWDDLIEKVELAEAEEKKKNLELWKKLTNKERK